jgi:putative ATP-binding cassette transporter
VKNIRSTLATVWRIAAPYFNSEDKWAGRGLLAAVIAIELALVGNDVLINLWRARFSNACRTNWDISSANAGVLCAGHHLVAPRSISLFEPGLQIRWRSWMTSNISRIGCMTPITTVTGRRRRQPRPAHERRRQLSSARHCVSVGCSARRPLASCRHPGLSAAPLVLYGTIYHPRLSGVGRADLRHLRHRVNAVDGSPLVNLDFNQQRMGGLPLQSGAEWGSSEQIALLGRTCRTRAAYRRRFSRVAANDGIMSRTKG